MATTNKYDRQLRLWGAKGQKALSEATVHLIRSGAAGTETLKNVVLPGVGRYVIWDDETVDNNNMPCNFFVTNSNDKSIPRAQMTCELLQELNPDTRGTWKHVERLIDVDWKTELRNSIVIASDLEPPLMEKIASTCSMIPLIAVWSYGLFGIVRLQSPPLPILDPKPTNRIADLRLAEPIESLKEEFNIDWNHLTNQQHGHVPYPLILLRMMNEWKQSHDDQLPTTRAEKTEFQQCIKTASRDFDKELNFQEAVNNAYLAYTTQTIDFETVKAQAANSPMLLSLWNAAEQFVQKSGRLPLHGSIPDMTASTELYVRLQRCYKEQAAKDLAQLKTMITDNISDDDLIAFCQNLHHVSVYQPRSIVQEWNNDHDDDIHEDLIMALMDPYEVLEHTPLLWYLGFRACQVFYQQHGRYPGTTNDHEFEKDIHLLQTCIVQIVNEYRLQDQDIIRQTLLNDDNKFARELTRNANAELHTVASIVGGVASQELVKLITGQYVPLDSVYVYNGIVSAAGVYRV